MRLHSSLLPLAAFVGFVACGPSAAVDATTSPIVGGQRETRYPAAGFLVGRIAEGPHAGTVDKAFCGAVLVSSTAVVTSAGCLREWSGYTTILAVGFGEIGNERVFAVRGEIADWINPASLPPNPDQPWLADPRADLAVIPLAQAVPADTIAPVPLFAGPVPEGTRGILVGYGHEAPPPPPPDGGEVPHPEVGGGNRKSTELVVELTRGYLHAQPVDNAGSVCFRDFGAPFLVDGRLAGIAAAYSDEVIEAALFDGVAPCRVDAGVKLLNLAFGSNPSFLASKLAEGEK